MFNGCDTFLATQQCIPGGVLVNTAHSFQGSLWA